MILKNLTRQIINIRMLISPNCQSSHADVCGKEVESVEYLASGSIVLAKRMYKKRHDGVSLKGLLGAG